MKQTFREQTTNTNKEVGVTVAKKSILLYILRLNCKI